MSERRGRRRRRLYAGGSVVRVPSDGVESQGEGTWVEFPKRLSVERHLEPIMRLQRWQGDVRLVTAQESGDGAAMLALMDEMRVDFARVLHPAITGWNWVTDMEGELDQGAFADPDDGRARLHLARAIWDGSIWALAEDGPPDLAGCVAWVGDFPVAERRVVVGVEDEGKTLVLEGTMPKCEAGTDWVLVGYPDPNDAAALEWCSIEELTFIGTALMQHFNAGQQARGSRPKAGRRH